MKKTMNYFKDCETLDEARKMYYKLAMKLHPDKGGDEEKFKELANLFDAFRPGKLKYENEVNDWSSKIYAHIISQLITIPNLIIEVCGSWIWISGDTLNHREKIKAIEVDEFIIVVLARRKGCGTSHLKVIRRSLRRMFLWMRYGSFMDRNQSKPMVKEIKRSYYRGFCKPSFFSLIK